MCNFISPASNSNFKYSWMQKLCLHQPINNVNLKYIKCFMHGNFHANIWLNLILLNNITSRRKTEKSSNFLDLNFASITLNIWALLCSSPQFPLIYRPDQLNSSTHIIVVVQCAPISDKLQAFKHSRHLVLARFIGSQSLSNNVGENKSQSMFVAWTKPLIILHWLYLFD